MKKFLISLVPALLALAALAAAPAAAPAAECRILTRGVGVPAPPCNNPPGNTAPQNLRDDADVTANFGTDGLAVNILGKLRFKASPGKVAATNENPKGYAFFGLKLDKNPIASNCSEATGWVPFVDIQNATPSAVFSGDRPAAPWTFNIRSDLCATNPGKVTIASVSLLFEAFGVTAAGSFTGVYQEPNAASCPAGGVKLDIKQPLITTVPASSTEPELDNGAGGNAFVCFVSANNYVFPTNEPVWTPLTGQIWKK
jgi:hypothetical protein